MSGRVTQSPPSSRGYRWLVAGACLFVCLYGGLAGLQWWLLAVAHERGRLAQLAFPGDEIDALVAVATSERRPLAERNDAVHALAQLADPRALPDLERLQTGRPCDHDHFVCQYELRKALERCRGERQPPAWLSRLPFYPPPAGPAD